MKELLDRCPSIYKLVGVASRRAKELAEGASKAIETQMKKVTSIALEEIRQGKVVAEFGQDEAARKGATVKRRTPKRETAKKRG